MLWQLEVRNSSPDKVEFMLPGSTLTDTPARPRRKAALSKPFSCRTRSNGLAPETPGSWVCCGNYMICNYGVFLGMSEYVLASWHHNQWILAGPGPLHLDVRHWLRKSLEDVVLHSITGTFRAMPLKCAALPMTGGCAVPITTAKA